MNGRLHGALLAGYLAAATWALAAWGPAALIPAAATAGSWLLGRWIRRDDRRHAAWVRQQRDATPPFTEAGPYWLDQHGRPY